MNSVREKINDILDKDSIKELWPNLRAYDYLEFADYKEKLELARTKNGKKDSVIAGIGAIENIECIIVAFEPLFMMGSMGPSRRRKRSKIWLYWETNHRRKHT